MSHEISDVLTKVALPKTQVTITLRVIKSFEYRMERSLVLHIEPRDHDSWQAQGYGSARYTTSFSIFQLVSSFIAAIQTGSGWKLYRNVYLG
jgi:hypothetical protein